MTILTLWLVTYHPFAAVFGMNVHLSAHGIMF